MDFDVIIIGAGQTAPPLSRALASAGKRVLIVDRARVGGSCVNFGCTPTKAAIASARLAHAARNGAKLGVPIPSFDVDFGAVIERAARIAERSRSSLEKSIKANDGVTLLFGHARLDGVDAEGRIRVAIGDEIHTSNDVVLNVGTRSRIPDVAGLSDIEFLHAGNWLSQRTRPEHVIIVGAGYVGLELGQFYRRMGSKVTVVDRGERIASREDDDVSDALRGYLEAEGIVFRLGSAVTEVARAADGVRVRIDSSTGSQDVTGSHMFIASGRQPNTDDCGLETVGIVPDDQGIVEVDERLASSVPGIWVAGDARGGAMFTHTAWDDHRVLASQFVGDRSRTTVRVEPYAMFTDPELGRVGLTERDARDVAGGIRIGRYEMRRSGRATEEGETRGFIKVIVGEDDQVLGAAVLARHGAELVHAFVDLMNARAPYTVLRDSVRIHPTLNEAVQSAVERLE